LCGHSGGVEEHILLVSEGLHQELEKVVEIGVLGFEELSRDDHTDYLFNQRVTDAIPSILGETRLGRTNGTWIKAIS